MKECIYEQKYRYGLNRCLRTNRLSYCHSCKCPYFKPTFWYKLFGKGGAE